MNSEFENNTINGENSSVEPENITNQNTTEENNKSVYLERADIIASQIVHELTDGTHCSLYQRINDLTVNDRLLADSFRGFIKFVDCGKTFTPADIIFSAENVIKGVDVFENAGNEIYCYDSNLQGVSIPKKLLKYSVGNIYALLKLNNGLLIDFKEIGETLSAGELKRFAVIPPKKVKGVISEASRNSIKTVHVGSVSSQNKFMITFGSDYVASVDKSALIPQAIPVSLTSEYKNDYIEAYKAVCGYYSCGCVSGNNVLRFGLNGSVGAVLARALGFFDACIYLKHIPVVTCFTSESSCNVAVARPSVSDGDYLYYLRVRINQFGLPEKAHHGQLNAYIKDRKKLGIIKNVLPVRENVDSVIARLCDENIKYVPLADVPEDSFGVIVSVARGESVNGIKLGFFTNNE